MKLEAGKTYKTAGGKKVRCLCIDANRGSGPPVPCLVPDSYGFDETRFYYLDGTAEPFAGKEEEIVGEWEKPVVGYMVLEDRRDESTLSYLAYATHVYKTIEDAITYGQYYRSPAKRSIIRVEFTPGVDQLGGE